MSEQVHVNKQDITNIANAIRTQKNEPASKKYKVNEMDEAIGTLVSPTGTINITSNGTVDVANYASANVNVSSDIVITNCKYLFSSNARLENINDILPMCKPTTAERMFSSSSNLTEIPLFDTSNCTRFSEFASYCSNLTSISLIDTSNGELTDSMFAYCSNLKTIPQLNFDNVTNCRMMFQNCTSLENVPVLSFSRVIAGNANSMFSNCSSLTNESLNNILATLLTMTRYYSNKTLSIIGLSQTQAETCTTLSNWQACVNAGWSTGY